MRMPLWRVLTLVLIGLVVVLVFAAAYAEGSHEYSYKKEPLSPEDELMQYDLRKQKKAREKYCRNQERTNKKLPYKRLCTKFNRNYLKVFLALFSIVSIGAIVRTILRVWSVNLPYTVVLIIVGLLIGIGSRNDHICVQWSMLTWLARAPPKLILNVFLPVLIYESAFSIKSHIFVKSSISIVLLALPGMIITTFLTAAVCMQFFINYNWNFKIASLYGSIISATDPVAVVAILKEIGTSEILTVMIEGESLFNDGVAILMYEIFLEVVKNTGEGNLGVTIVRMFCQITLGGPLFGWFTGKVCVFFLSRIFNDPPVEVSITLVSAYLTYFIGESFLGVSGVMAVVTLGIVMSMERTCISPEVQSLVHHFWEMIAYLGNTVLFVMVGIVISETAINTITLSDVYYLIFLYFSLNIARLLMIVVLSPFLSRLGYGLTWQNMLVMSWGGLRGAVAICLSLEVFKDRYLCNNIYIGPKFLLQTAGIVILTLLVNGTTTKCLLSVLKLTQLSMGKLQDMSNAVKQIHAAQGRTLAVLKHDRFLSDACWGFVVENTRFENPYAITRVQPKSRKPKQCRHRQDMTLLVDTLTEDHHIVCPACEEDVEVEPTADEYREMTEECRLRLLKAMKVSCWRQFEQGVLTEEAVQVLIEFLDTVEDNPFQMFHAVDLKKFWIVKGGLAWLRDKLMPHTLALAVPEEAIPEPKQSWRGWFYRTATNDWFDGMVHTIIIVNMIPILWEVVYICMDKPFTEAEVIGFLTCNAAFCLFYFSEFLIKIIGFGPGGYCSCKWNILDCLILLVILAEMALSLTFVSQAHDYRDYQDKTADTDFLKFLRLIRLLRITRIFRLFRPLVPPIMKFLNSRINVFLFLGYDIGKGLATAIDDVKKFLPQMIDNVRVFDKFKQALEDQRQRLMLEMGLLQRDHPGIAIAVKTRHASRGVLNQMRDSLIELKEDGLVDDKEFDILLKDLEGKMKRLWDAEPFMLPPRPEMLLANLQWVQGDKKVLAFILKEATMMHFAVGELLFSIGDDPSGIFVVVSGVVKIQYDPLYDRLKRLEDRGIIPVVEMYTATMDDPMIDYVTSGSVLGELGVLSDNDRAASASCETGVVVYHLSKEAILTAIEMFGDPYDSLESRMWRAIGMRIAAVVLPSQPAFQSWTLDKLKTHLEFSAVPVGPQYAEITIPAFITDTILVYGQVVNGDRESEIYTAPVVIPHRVKKIKPIPPKPPPERIYKPIDAREITPRILFIANQEMENAELIQYDEFDFATTFNAGSLQRCILARKNRNYIVEEEVMNLKRPTLERENLDLDPDGMNRQGSSFEMSHITSLTDYSDSTSGSASVPLPQNK